MEKIFLIESLRRKNMLRPTAIKVFPQEDYTLRIIFDNGEEKLFDVKPYIKGNWYGELKEKR